MKNIRKVLMLVGLLAFTVLLVSCGKKPDTTANFYFYDVDNSNLVVDSLDDSLSIPTLKFYTVQNSGAVVELVVDGVSIKNATSIALYDKDNNEVSDLENAVKKVYTYTLGKDKNTEEVVQYLSGSDISDKSMYLDFIDFNEKGKVTRSGAVLTHSYIFEGQNIEYYEISSEGVNEVNVDQLTFTGFPEGDDLIENKKYINHVTFPIEGKYGDQSFEFNIRLSANAKPISTKTATFWNWVTLKMPIAFAMSFFGKITGNSFALAILLTTLLVRTLAWPIYSKTNDMSMKMQLAQPDLDKLNKKYAMKKDPESQQKMQMEMMAIYKKHNINFLGCLLPILQMPIFIAMYQVVQEITVPGGQFYNNVSNTQFFASDLATGGMIANIIFTALVGLSMWGLQKISSMKPSYAKQSAPVNKDPKADQQAQTMKMVSFMMVMMMVMTSYLTPGLSLSYYWVIGNIYSLSQTLLNRYISKKKFEKLENEKLYGRSREIIEAQFKEKGDK